MGKKGGAKGKAAAPAHTEEVVDDVEENNSGVEEAEEHGDEGQQSAQLKKAGEETDLEEVLERHRRELKDMKNEVQRLKKQVTQGDKKKKKEIQTEIERLEESTAKRHQAEVTAFKATHKGEEKGALEEKTENLNLEGNGEEEEEEGNGEEEEEQPGKRISKAQKKKAKKEERNNELRRQAEEEAAKAPNLKQIEEEKIAQACARLGLEVKQISPDGHCLYNAVADQLRSKGVSSVDFKALRSQVAAFLRSHADDYLPFMTNDEGDMLDEEGFKAYCNKLENTAEWGGQLEIQVISKIFQCPVFVLQAGTPPLTIGDEFKTPALQLSYHRHAYGLGEHYNSLIPKA